MTESIHQFQISFESKEEYISYFLEPEKRIQRSQIINKDPDRFRAKHSSPTRFGFALLLLLSLTLAFDSLYLRSRSSHSNTSSTRPFSSRDAFLKCSIEALDSSPLKEPLVEPIPFEEFQERRDILARALHHEKVDAFIIEPGFAEVYYANLSSFKWESWEPEERPFLLVIQPLNSSSGIKAKTTMLVPAFEEARARQLNLPLDQETTWLKWKEHENPYQVLASHLDDKKKVVLGDELRLFISQGLSEADFTILPFNYTSSIALVSQQKSEREIAILRAVNTLTINGIRATRMCAYDGVSELEFSQVLDDTMRSVGLEPFFDLVLFGENGACPHCSSTLERKLDASRDMILVDVGAHLFGYSSDVARTFFLPSQANGNSQDEDNQRKKKLKVWNTVLEAQTAAMNQFYDGNMASQVDLAARKVIEKAGYGRYFTHRLGHGIGIKAHEPPYLNKGNVNTPLRRGMVFTAEPGIYLEGEFGVRHEDIFLVTEDGPELLSGKRAVSPWEP